jgi:hypothetical protein
MMEFFPLRQYSCHNWDIYTYLYIDSLNGFPSPVECNLQYIDIIHLTATGKPPGGSSTVHMYTQTIQRTTQNTKYIEQHKH